MAFELVDTHRVRSGGNHIRVSKAGRQIYIGLGLIKEHGLSECLSVNVRYDKENIKVGIEFLNDGSGQRKLSKWTHGTGHMISAANVIKLLNLKSGTYPDVKMEEFNGNKMLTIDVSQPPTP